MQYSFFPDRPEVPIDGWRAFALQYWSDFSHFGVWRSWLARLVWDQEAEGSNPFTPTIIDIFIKKRYEILFVMLNMSKEKILHIGTGGTIDGCVPEYPEIERLGAVFPDFYHVDKFVRSIFQVHADFESERVCKKDSREITDDDRMEIVKKIREAFQTGVRRFLITHGTYTMPETGIFIIQNLADEVREQVSVVLTGSMYPWSLIGSDAPMNLGAALSSLLNSKEALGVMISMHGKLFHPSKVRKDVEKLLFEETE